MLTRVLFAVLLLAAPAAMHAQIVSEYSAFWSENGSTSFLRLLPDSTIIVMRVRHTPHRESQQPSVRFSRLRLRCDVAGGADVGFATLRVGITEASVLEPPTSQPSFVTTGWGAESEQSSMVFTGCMALRQRR